MSVLLLASVFLMSAQADTLSREADIVITFERGEDIDDCFVRACTVQVDDLILDLSEEGTLRCDRTECTVDVGGDTLVAPTPDPSEGFMCWIREDGTCNWIYVAD